MEKKPRGFFNSLWTLGVPFSSWARTSGFLLDLFIYVSISLSVSLSQYSLPFKASLNSGYRIPEENNGKLTIGSVTFQIQVCFPFPPVDIYFSETSNSCIMHYVQVYCCIYKRKWLLCVYSILPRTGFLACFVCFLV